MKICRECGCSFEGSFCPECGAKWHEDGVCPECGAKILENAKFCNECGAKIRVEKQPKQNKGLPPIFALLIRALPAGLLLCFSLALFICYAMNAMNFWGMDVGNMYALAKDTELGVLQGWAITLIVLAVLLLVFSFVYIAISLIPYFKSFLLWRIGWPEACGIVAVGGYFLTLALSIGFAIQVGREEAELGIGVIFIIICAALFLLCGVGAVLLWIVLFGGKEKQKQDAEIEARRGEEPQAPEKVDKPIFVVEGKRKSLLKKLWAKKIFVTAIWVPILGVIGLLACLLWVLVLGNIAYLFLIEMVCAGIFAAVAVYSMASARAYKWKLKTIASFGFKFTMPFIIMLIPIMFGVVFGGLFISECREAGHVTFNEFAGGNLLICLLSFGVAGVGLAGLIVLKILRGKMAAYTKTEEFAELEKAYQKDVVAYKEALLEYKKYKKEETIYRYQLSRWRSGRSYERLPKYPILWLLVHKWVALLLAVVLAFGALGACVAGGAAIKYYNTIFRASKVDDLSVGDSKQDVIKILGEPHYNSEEDSILMEETEGGVVYEYYDGEYKKLYDQYIKAAETFSLMEMASLEAEMSSITYKYICVRFGVNNAVEEIVYDANHCNSMAKADKAEKQSKCSWLGEPISIMLEREEGSIKIGESSQVGDVKAETYYSDGSYRQYALYYSGNSKPSVETWSWSIEFRIAYSSDYARDVAWTRRYDIEQQRYENSYMRWVDSWGEHFASIGNK